MGWSRGVRTGLTGSLLVLLIACGGGGGGGGSGEPTVQSPPATAAVLESSGLEAIAAVRAAVDGGAQIAGHANGAATLFLPSGDPFGRSGADALARAQTSGREHALEVRTVACADFLGAPCAGSVTIDVDFDPNADTVAAGSRLGLSFHGLEGNLEGVPVMLDGTLRIDFLTAFDGANLAGTQFRVIAGRLLGTVDGISFGPETSALLVAFDAQERATLTVDGMRFSELDGIAVDDADDYRIGNARLRRAHWGDPAAYVDCRYAAWVSAAARTAAGSVATFTAGSDRIVVTTTASNASLIVYSVDITVGGATRRFIVTASFSGNTPSYAAEEA